MHYNHRRLVDAMAKVGDTKSPQVAQRLDVHPATAWRLIKGRSKPAGETLAAIEREYGLTAADLYGGAQ
ncbi:helix-turn-helix domain-containing protein [Streptomyces sp. ASQP_92]|uniref:helix-turn-helix domain-containing protein n=1 Tax=Streptomyces sp. ASQP_92 TaxID=2979116 RepID=UPI0021C0CF2D|nr:helix-turn-helix transcriptional regulator [Streptomyces sp. ASQP_92]MCT9090611.1 helix-turn-helix domain-containing protein [Streptomyces sp. ASQP_92]